MIGQGLAFAETAAEQHHPDQGLRSKYVNANTHEYQYAAYLEAWRRKIERIGNMNYPSDAERRSLQGRLVLEVVLNAEGGIHDILLLRTSGYKLLDDAAVRIVQRSAPFAPFPPDIRKETDLLHITRTWQFRVGVLSGVPGLH